MRCCRVAATAACAALLGACGSGSASPTGPVPTATGAVPTAVPGVSFSNSHFVTVVPVGWTSRLSDTTEVRRFSGSGEVEFLVEQQPPGSIEPGVNDVVATINVVLLAIPVPDDQIAQYLSSISDSGATNLSSAKPFTIGDATGQYITYDRDIAATPGESQDMVINHGGATYDIVISTSQFAYPQQHPALQAILTAWRWT